MQVYISNISIALSTWEMRPEHFHGFSLGFILL